MLTILDFIERHIDKIPETDKKKIRKLERRYKRFLEKYDKLQTEKDRLKSQMINTEVIILNKFAKHNI